MVLLHYGLFTKWFQINSSSIVNTAYEQRLTLSIYMLQALSWMGGAYMFYKHLLFILQIMDMSPDELKLVANHMGHSVTIHTNIYKLQSSVLERTKVARALVALENGKLADFHGRPLNSIGLEGKCIQN